MFACDSSPISHERRLMARFIASGLILTSSLIALAAGVRAETATVPGTGAILQALDKVTARTTRLDIPVGKTATFGTLRILVHACRKAPPEDTPESAAHLDIVEIRPGAAEKPLFSGWMFASSPALSALEHPVYDIWVKDCVMPPGQVPASPSPAPAATPEPEDTTPSEPPTD